MSKEMSEIDREILDVLLRSRYSNTVLRRIYNHCEVCERPLEDEYFIGIDDERLVSEREPILEGIKDLIRSHGGTIEELKGGEQ